MKWTTNNVKHATYVQNHEIYVGTQTGLFKKILTGNEEKPFGQKNLLPEQTYDKTTHISALAFAAHQSAAADKPQEILVGRGNNIVQQYSLAEERITNSVKLQASHVVGVARFDEQLYAGFANGQVQRIGLNDDDDAAAETTLFSSGDNMVHMRQCATSRNLVATGGKGRQNNLKVFDMEAAGKQVFNSKNLPNDYLQLEVPVWDSDVGFIDNAHTLATCSRHGYVRVYDTRKQRRPVQCFATEDQMSFTSLEARGNYIYAGTTIGALKAFDIRRMKNFVHTYKGFTGSITDLHLDASGKYLASSSLDRYVRLHHVDSCVLLYQCYVKLKATRVLLRESFEQPKLAAADNNKNKRKRKAGAANGNDNDDDEEDVNDDEYENMFENMQTVCEASADENSDEASDDEADGADESDEADEAEEEQVDEEKDEDDEQEVEADEADEAEVEAPIKVNTAAKKSAKRKASASEKSNKKGKK